MIANSPESLVRDVLSRVEQDRVSFINLQFTDLVGNVKSVTITVEQFYRRAGMPVLDRCIEMADHLGLELEFMAALCRLEAELEDAGDPAALERCLDLQRTFLEEHLSRWAPACCENVVRHARYGFYKAIAHLTREFLGSEEARLGIREAQGARPCESGPPSR